MIRTIIFQALLSFFFACSSNPQNTSSTEQKAVIYYDHGTRLLMEKKYTEALRNLIEAEKLNSKDSKIQNNLGMAYYFKNAKAKAKNHLKRSLELDKTNSDARNNLASLYFEEGNHLLAEKEYQTILKDLVYPHQYRTYYNLGLIYKKKNNFVQAKQYFELSAKENENYCPAHFELGMEEFSRQNYSQATVKFKDAASGQCFNNVAAHFYSAASLMRSGKLSLAKEKLLLIKERFTSSQYLGQTNAMLERLSHIPVNPVLKKFVTEDKYDKNAVIKSESKQQEIQPKKIKIKELFKEEG